MTLTMKVIKNLLEFEGWDPNGSKKNTQKSFRIFTLKLHSHPGLYIFGDLNSDVWKELLWRAAKPDADVQDDITLCRSHKLSLDGKFRGKNCANPFKHEKHNAKSKSSFASELIILHYPYHHKILKSVGKRSVIHSVSRREK